MIRASKSSDGIASDEISSEIMIGLGSDEISSEIMIGLGCRRALATSVSDGPVTRSPTRRREASHMSLHESQGYACT